MRGFVVGWMDREKDGRVQGEWGDGEGESAFLMLR